jgi:FkbM family methyltransferase
MLAAGGASVAHLYDELFCDEVYESPKPIPRSPRIVDAGGHLGLASLYFLFRYPGCKLTTFEPNPTLAALLRRNLAPWASQSELIEAALSIRGGSVDFHITEDNPLNVTGGIDNRELPDRRVSVLQVKSVDVRVVLNEPVDLMKLDVEGHEYELLRVELFNPHHIKNLIVEFHDIDRRRAEFAEILRLLLDERGYRVASQNDVELPASAVRTLTECAVIRFF